MSVESLTHWLTPVLFAASVIVVFLVGRQRVQGTTFVGPWYWALAALSLAAVGSLYAARSAMSGDVETPFFATLSFGMATIFFCPIVSVLGAKRPQDSAWHLIVASLWVVLILPAAESALVRRGGTIQIHDARAWFLWALIVVTFLNYVFTRYVAVAILCCAAIIVWLSPYLPGLRWQMPDRMFWAALLLAAAVGSYLLFRKWKSPAQHPLDETWIDFRDTFGVTWGLRVMERVNNAATIGDWPARLEWDGFKVGEAITEEQQKALRASFDGIMRRFL